jgi:outer membrane lipoprotein carrier protein
LNKLRKVARVGLVAAMIVLLPAAAPLVRASSSVAAGSLSKTELKSLLAHLQRHYQDTTSFKANFKETISRAGAAPRERDGTIYYSKPGRLHWEFAQPQPETIVSDGKLIYDYDPGLNQVVETPLEKAFKSQSAAGFLLGVGNVSRDFDASAVAGASDDGLSHIALTPKGGGDRIEIGVDRQTFDIVTLALTDALGNRTKLEFGSIERNIPIEASMFTFSVPAGADIVSSQGNQQ